MYLVLVGMFFISVSLSGCAIDVGSTKYLKVTGSICAESDILPFDCKTDGVEVKALNGVDSK